MALPIGPEKIRTAIRTGSLKASRIGTWNRIRWSDFLAWLDATQVDPAPHGEGHINPQSHRNLRVT